MLAAGTDMSCRSAALGANLICPERDPVPGMVLALSLLQSCALRGSFFIKKSKSNYGPGSVFIMEGTRGNAGPGKGG